MTSASLTRDVGTPAELRRVMHTDYEVSPQQWEAISAPLEPAVVIAGAGSGKTSLMAARVIWLVVTGQVTPDQVLGLTFTTKAAGELRSRIRDALDAAGFARGVIGDDGEEEVLEPMVATYNAYAASLLTEHGLRIGHEPDTRVVSDAARYQLAGRVIDRHTRPVERLSDSPPHVIQWLLSLDGAMAEHLVDVSDVRGFDEREAVLFAAELTGKDGESVAEAFARREELLDLVEHYRRQKRDLGLMDFSDQIALAARLAADQPLVGALEREKYRIVLLDEYQDTSVAQALMLSRLFSGPDPATGRGHAVTAVGDPHQAIYGWRGASVSNILRFGEDFPSPTGDDDVPTYPLTVNRRSDTRVLDAANALSRPLHDAFRQVQPLEPGRDDAGEVQVAVHETYADELVWLAERVHHAHDSDVDRGWREIGVLVRDNAHAADVFDALTSREIPVEIVGLKGLLRLPEVAEVLATLTLVHDLSANSELIALLTGPRWAVGPRDLALLGRRARALADAQPGRAGSGTIDEELARAVGGSDPTEVVSLDGRARRPRRPRLLRGRPSPVRAAVGRAPAAAVPRVRVAPRARPPDHRQLRHRRRAGVVGQRRRACPPGEPRPVRQGGRRVPGRRRRCDPARAARLARGRARRRGPRRRDPVPGRLGQAAHRPPGQGPGVGLGVHRRGLREPVPPHHQPRRLADPPGVPADAPAWRRARPAVPRRATMRLR